MTTTAAHTATLARALTTASVPTELAALTHVIITRAFTSPFPFARTGFFHTLLQLALLLCLGFPLLHLFYLTPLTRIQLILNNLHALQEQGLRTDGC